MSLTMSAAEKEVRLMRLFDMDMVGSEVAYTAVDDASSGLSPHLSHVLVIVYVKRFNQHTLLLMRIA